jgi:hypothetical protein
MIDDQHDQQMISIFSREVHFCIISIVRIIFVVKDTVILLQNAFCSGFQLQPQNMLPVIGIVVIKKESQPANGVATSRLCRRSSQAPLTSALAMSRVFRKYSLLSVAGWRIF